MLLLATVVALIIVWGLGSFNVWGLSAHKNILLIFLGIALVLQVGLRGRVRPR